MGKVAIVTGVKRIGREISEHLLRKGYDLALVYRSSDEEVKRLEEIAGSLGRRVLLLKGDLSEEDFCKKVVEETYSEFGRIDALIHLASPYFRTPIEEVSAEDIDRHFRPIAMAFVLLSKEAYKRMLLNEGDTRGHILAFGDWAVEHTPYKNYSAYFLAKGALHTAVKVLAKEFAPHVPVNCIALGPTLKAEDLTEEEWERILKNTPLKRAVSLKEVCELTEFLLKTESMTGEVIMVDGGRHIAGSGLGSVG